MDPAIRKIGCWLGADHPLYRALPQTLAQVEPAATFYIRIPDLAAFIRQIAPVLEERLAASIAVGHSGEMRLNFYRSGMILKWTTGQLFILVYLASTLTACMVTLWSIGHELGWRYAGLVAGRQGLTAVVSAVVLAMALSFFTMFI